MKKTIVLTSTLILTAGIIAWAWAAHRPEEDEKVAEMEDMIESAFANEEEEENQTVEQKAERFRQMGKMAESLTVEQSLQLAKTFIPMMIKRREREMEKFFTLSPEEQQEKLDEQIDEEEKWREYAEQRRAEREAEKSTDGGTAQSDQAETQNAEPRRRGPWSKFSDKDRERMRRMFMDSTSPETRARFQEYRRMMNERRKERGLPPSRRGGPR